MQTITLKGYGTDIPPYEAIELGTYDSYGVEQLQIVPAYGWENLSITASFFPPSGVNPIKVAVLSSGIIDVPQEATARQSGKGIIVFAGYKANTQLISTDVAYKIRDHKDIASGDPVCPTPSVVEQIMNAANAAKEDAEKAANSAKKAEDVADSIRNDADEGKFNGEDGYSPSANVTQIENGAVISIRDKTGESTATIYNGKDGAKGDKGDTGDKGNTGAKGDKGDKGFSPTAAVTQLENGAEITITDEKGTTKAIVKNGIKGDKGDRGSNGVSPTISVEDIENGHRVTIVDATGTTSVDIYNGEDGIDGKDGVQIDDAAVSEDAPWSSKHIIDMLCPPLEESGNPVVCYPVAGYPLGVKASWEPVQEGSGTPSPENIRPIKGRDSVTVNRTDKLRAWKILTLTGEESWAIRDTFVGVYNLLSPTDNGKGICTHFDVKRNYSGDCIIIEKNGTVYLGRALSDKYTVDTWRAYLAAQYAAGTPVQVCYKLAEPVPFTATGAQPIPALAGANTVLTDADSATVTGRADPIKRITDLEDAVASQT